MPAFDLGDSLFVSTTVPEGDRERQETRARLILMGLAAEHTAGLVVGERDLSLGLPFLTAAAAEAKVPLLSANLRDASGKPLFEGHWIVSAGVLKIGLVAVSKAIGYPDGIQGDDPAAAAREELKQLNAGGCDLKILLAHLTRADLDRVLQEAPGFDLAAVAHEGWQGPPQTSGGIPVVYVGQRGRSILRLDLETAGGSEPLVDLGALDRTKQEAESIDRRIQETKKQMASAKDPSAYKQMLQALERRRKELAATQRKEGGYHRRAFRTEAVDLGPGVADDPEMQKAVQAYLAKYPADASDHPPPPMPGMPPGGRLPAGIFPAPRPGPMPIQPTVVPPQPGLSPQPGMTQAPRQPLRLAPSAAPTPTGPVP